MSLKSLLVHLRLNWQLILMPIFLWGFFLSGGALGLKFWVGLFVFHVFFYGGSVAFNSYYDQDEGPIGGLWNPPRPTRTLLVFSLLIQVAGLILVAWLINLPLLLVSLVMATLSTAYSHPAVRLKRHPWASLLTVSIGQGIGGAVAGWLCGQDDPLTLLSLKAGLGLLTSALIATGFYPLSQVYQRAEDARRGDITFAVRWGTRCFPFAMACLTLAALAGAYLMGRYYGPGEAAVVAAALLGMVGLIYDWWRHFDESQVRANYVRLMRLGYLMGVGFLVYLGLHWVR
jgi:4-hydroxybenzoate polyprenyltransferase